MDNKGILNKIFERRRCIVDDCNEEHYAKGLCFKHYRRQWYSELTTTQIKCSVLECDKPSCAKGLCQVHYKRWRISGSTDVRERKEKFCCVSGCGEKYYCKGFCTKHYQRLKTKGSAIARTMQDPNEYVDCGEYWEIKLYDRESNHVASAKIDPEDVEKCRQYKWSLNGQGYASSSGVSHTLLLHRFVMGVTDPSVEVDHQDRNTLDDRKSQLRVCDSFQQAWNRKKPISNTSGVKNVYWDKNDSQWHVQVVSNGKRYNVHFNDFEEACEHAEVMAVKLHGEFARRE